MEFVQAIDAATQANSNLAIAYEENALRALDDIDQTLRLLEREFRQHGIDHAREFTDAWSVDLELVRGMGLATEDGTQVIATAEALAIDIGRRDEFRSHLEGESRALHIGRPESAPFKGSWRAVMSRRIDKADGSFLGVVFAVVDPAHLTHFHKKADLGSDGLVTLVGRDGITLSRHAGGLNTAGADMRASTLMARQAVNPNGSFVSRGKLEGVRRLSSYRTMARYPLIVMVGVSEPEVLAAVRERARFYYLIAMLGSVVVLLAAFSVRRARARRERFMEAIDRGQARLVASEAKSRAITENMAGGLIISDLDGTITGVNRAACRMHGYASGEMVGLPLSRLVHESGRTGLAVEFAKLQDPRGEYQNASREFVALRKDGTTFEAQVLVGSVEIDGKRIVIGIVQDFSERKELERAMRASEAHFRATFDQALVGIGHVDLAMRFIRVNQTLCEMLGYSEQELLALSLPAVVDPEDLSLAAPLAGPDRFSTSRTTKRYVRKDGSTMWAVTSVSLICDDRGQTRLPPRDDPGRERAEARRADEDRVRLRGEPQAAHAAHLDSRLARVALGRRRGPARRTGAQAGVDRGEQLRAPHPARERHPRHRKNGVGQDALRPACAGPGPADRARRRGMRGLRPRAPRAAARDLPPVSRSAAMSTATASSR